MNKDKDMLPVCCRKIVFKPHELLFRYAALIARHIGIEDNEVTVLFIK